MNSPKAANTLFSGRNLHCWLAALLFAASDMASGDTYPLPPADMDLIGGIELTHASRSDTLLDIARRHNLGQNAIVIANPDVDRWLPGEGRQVVLSKRHILPNAERRGLVLNIAEMRIYYYPEKSPSSPGNVVITHPVSIGRVDWTTPLGKARVVRKVKDPVWRPPESIKQEHAADGEILPDVVPAGPDNPLGRYAIRLSIPGYLIHSTNKPFGIGMRVTHGCVRMYPEDIEALFDKIPVGEQVMIVNQPVKMGWLMDQLYIEVHPLLEEDSADQSAFDYTQLLDTALDMVEIHSGALGGDAVLDGQALKQALQQKTGIPVRITKQP